MPKRKQKRPAATTASSKTTRRNQKSRQRKKVGKTITASKNKPEKAESTSKQDLLIAMLQSPSGATIDALMRASGWQQHSVRGFLAGVVRKRLKLKLGSTETESGRVYRITGGVGGAHQPRSSERAN